jgi:hypothetical protein
VPLCGGPLRPFFFLWCYEIFDRACATDLLIDLQKSPTEFAEPVKGLDFMLGLLQLGSGRKGLADALTAHFACQAVVGAVAGLTRLVAAAVRLAAAPANRGDGTAAEIAQFQYLNQNGGSFLFQSRERSRQRNTSNPNVSIRKDSRRKK